MGDHFVYPDCRPGFIQAFDAMQKKAVEGFGDESLRLYAPFVEWSKADIVAAGAVLGVPYANTWSCYEGGRSIAEDAAPAWNAGRLFDSRV